MSYLYIHLSVIDGKSLFTLVFIYLFLNYIWADNISISAIWTLHHNFYFSHCCIHPCYCILYIWTVFPRLALFLFYTSQYHLSYSCKLPLVHFGVHGWEKQLIHYLLQRFSWVVDIFHVYFSQQSWFFPLPFSCDPCIFLQLIWVCHIWSYTAIAKYQYLHLLKIMTFQSWLFIFCPSVSGQTMMWVVKSIK